MSFFDLTFAQQVVTTAIGVVLGWPVAALITSAAERRTRESSRIQLASALRDALEKNLWLLGILENGFLMPGSEVPTFSLDLTVLEGTAIRKYELIEDSRTCVRVDGARYELRHVDEKLRLLRESMILMQDGHRFLAFMETVKATLREHVPAARIQIRLALESLPSPPARGDAYVG